jgi:hypothetical protein
VRVSHRWRTIGVLQEPIMNHAGNLAPPVWNLLPAMVVAMLPALLLTLIPQGGLPAGRSFIDARDTINGQRITDPVVIERIERIAAGVPLHLLDDAPRAAQVRYLAHAFESGDDAAISYGIFRGAAAALAFGCALDDDLVDRCELTPVAATPAAYVDGAGLRCAPMRVALGAPAYEPDRCEVDG